MFRVNINEAKTYLSKYLEQVKKGGDIIICKRGHPIAMLKAYHPVTTPRKLGGDGKAR